MWYKGGKCARQADFNDFGHFSDGRRLRDGTGPSYRFLCKTAYYAQPFFEEMGFFCLFSAKKTVLFCRCKKKSKNNTEKYSHNRKNKWKIYFRR